MGQLVLDLRIGLHDLPTALLVPALGLVGLHVRGVDPLVDEVPPFF